MFQLLNQKDGWVGGFFLEENETKIIWHQNKDKKIEYFLERDS